ncbi:MAG: N-6 DNA methylase [Ignavibacteriales bacterium]|nr:N-6 DNA methylase [Ignavibacteriales bacterium]
MAIDRIAARQQIEKLVQFFESNIYQFKSSTFNETQARGQLIDPFFEALGWDVHNRLMLPLFRQEVMPESRVKTNVGKEVREQEPLFPKKETLGKEYKEYTSILDYIAEDEYKASSKEAVKKPDYRFRIGGQTKFFVEAKKPSVDLVKSQGAIFQVKRYGFSGRVPLAILTDFDEFRTFDCTQRPLFEKPKLGVIHDFDLTYKQYLDRFDLLYDTFSREAVAGGSLEALTKKMMLKRTGDFALDREFLEDLSKWREELARDIAKHPKNRRLLNDYTLNEAVQRILDRIVFIRVCEDREIEVENTLLAILRMWKERRGLSLYSLLNDLFKQRRSLYNGLLFSQHPCEEMEVGDEVLIKILENLNYPFSPYHFNEIGVEILGSIYEKFLGKTIHLAPKNVVIKEKPEVRKAGGVYYTPQYIVKYIVENTIGKMLYEEPEKPSEGISAHSQEPSEGNKRLKLSPKQVSKLKIIDIACGSGSFLLGAFQKLIDYSIEWYTAHPEDIKTENNVPDAYKDTDGNYHLSPRKKRDILVNNIYGVDIDRQAVEVTQMSLYLKVLEGENAETLNPQMTLALKEVYLPSLAKNIKCGNSLIGTDFTSQGEMFDDEARRKVNPFDWEMEFPEILGGGGKPSEGSPSETKKPSEGSHGFDVVIGNPPYVRPHNIEEYAKEYYWLHYKTFVKKSDLYCCFLQKAIYILKNRGMLGYIISDGWMRLDSFEVLRNHLLNSCIVSELTELPDKVFEDATVKTGIVLLEKNKLKQERSSNEILIIRFDEDKKVFERERGIEQELFENTYKNVFDTSLSPQVQRFKNRISVASTPLGNLVDIRFGLKTADDEMFIGTKKASSKHKPLLRGDNVSRYGFQFCGEYVWYVPEKMREHRNTARPGEPTRFEQPKILVKDTSSRLGATLDVESYYVKDVLLVTKKSSVEISLQYILGLINSKMMKYYYESTFPTLHVQNEELASLPIHTIDFAQSVEKKMHDDLVSLVEKMLEFNKQLQKAHFDSEKEPIERQIAATDKKIDDIVYELYGLTEEEIKIVEGKTS